MNSTIMVQKSVKDEAAKKAKSEGLSLSTVTRFLLKEYAEGKLSIGVTINESIKVSDVQNIELDTATQQRLDASAASWRDKVSTT